MNGLDFIDGLSDVDMKYVAEADERPAVHRGRWQRYVALAASFALTVLSGTLLFLGNGSDPTSTPVPDGLGSLISSTSGLLWITLAAGVLGMIIAVVLIAKGPKEKE